MPYVINDALDELLDLLSGLLWPKGKAVEQAQGIDIPSKPRIMEVAQKLSLQLTDEQLEALGARVRLRVMSKSPERVKVARPQLCVANLIPLDNLRSDGLLGRLVAQYWASARARAWYQVRCGALSWDDDTPTWSQREKQLISDADRKSALKNPKWFGVALSNANFLDRWDGGLSKSTKWRRRYSLEATFSNWSAPPFFEWAFDDSLYFGEPGGQTVDESPGRWGGKVESSGSNSIYASGQKRAPIQWDAFLSGEAEFGAMMETLTDVYVFHGYKEYVTNWQNRGTYADVGTGPRAHLGALPWRTFGKHVSAKDRRSANYRMKSVLGSWPRTKKAVERYYTNGYYLVRTALDVILARGELPTDHKGFEAHCEWWGVACPDRRMVRRYPDLSSIAGGIVGLAGASSDEIVRYVMGITPKPGTVPPWEDKGPLWSWPDTLGNMECKSVPILLKPRVSDNVWGTIAQFILGVEQSFCANVASGALDVAVDMVVEKALEIAAEWLSKGVEEIMEALESQLGGAFWSEAKALIEDVSATASNIARFADADKLVGEVAAAANLPTALTRYLDGVADNLPAEYLDDAKDTFETQVDALRRQWDWADDLIGSAASMGDRVKSQLGSLKDPIKD